MDLEQLSLLEPPSQKHSRTSRQAAKAIREKAPTLRERVFGFVAMFGPVTDEEIANGLKLNPSTARPRRIELVAAGLVRAAPDTKRTTSDREATAWVISD